MFDLKTQFTFKSCDVDEFEDYFLCKRQSWKITDTKTDIDNKTNLLMCIDADNFLRIIELYPETMEDLK